MPFPNFDPLDEGEALTADSLNSKLQDTRDSINALPADALTASSLRSEHLAPITLNNLSTDAAGNAVNMTHVNPTPTAISANYDNLYTATPVTTPNARGTFLGWGDGLGGTGWAGIAVSGGISRVGWPRDHLAGVWNRLEMSGKRGSDQSAELTSSDRCI